MDLLDDETDYGAKFFNPANDDVQNFVLQLLADLAKYDLDGIILDRCRYDDYGLESDFSDISKQKFEEYIGETIANFPADIMAPGTDEIPSDQPVYFKKWLEFRAKVIHDFIVKAREKVKSVNNNIKFGVYVGAWYSTYYTSGVNWASPKYNTSAYYPKWATSDYKNYGYADHLDYIFLGAYASVNNIYGSGEWTMEGFVRMDVNCYKEMYLLQADQISVTVPDGLTEDNLQKFRMLLMLVSVIVTASLPSTFATLRNTTIGTLLKQALINIWNLSKNEV